MSEIYSYPRSLKKLRACFSCHLIKTEEQFIEEGCENCGGKWNKTEAIQRITSNFKGMIAITNPKFSWCGKWLHKPLSGMFVVQTCGCFSWRQSLRVWRNDGTCEGGNKK